MCALPIYVRTPSGPDRSGRGPYYGEKAMSMTEEQWQKGLEVFDQVYGPGSSDMVKPFKDSPFNQEIVANQFGNLWGNEELTIREKRLMVLGATTMLGRADLRSEEHTSELQSLMRISYAVFCLKKKNQR